MPILAKELVRLYNQQKNSLLFDPSPVSQMYNELLLESTNITTTATAPPVPSAPPKEYYTGEARPDVNEERGLMF